MQTYLFYDIETTGLNKSFDQVLQFAAIRTDLNLKEIERYELKVKLNPDVIPSPYAVLTHHIGIKEAQTGISEWDAIRQIHQWMNAPGTISLGYNTLGFDDEFLRFSFYRNLLPPYTHQYANQCGRMDCYPIAIMFYLFKNHVLKWPEKNGRVSLKLEDINDSNKFASGRAHNAMVDVEATLALTECFFKERETWDYLIGYFNKKIDEERSTLASNEDALMVYGKFGNQQNFLSPVISLGTHYHYKNQLWLRLDSENLTNTSSENIKETTWAVRKKLGEPGFILPRKDRFLGQVKQDILTLSQNNKRWLFENPALLQQIKKYHAEFKYPEFPKADIESRLYLDGFWSSDEDKFCRQFHQANSKEKSSMTDQLRKSKLKQMAVRIMGRHFPDTLTDSQAEDFSKYLQQTDPNEETDIMIDFRGEQRLTCKKALAEISEIRKKDSLSDTQILLLDELKAYIEKK